MAKKKKKKAVKKRNVNSAKKKKKNGAKKIVNNTSKKVVSTSKVKSNVSSSKDLKSKKRVSATKNKKKVNNKNAAVVKNSSKSIKLIIIVFVILLFCMGISFYFFSKSNKTSLSTDILKISFDEYLDLYDNDEIEFVYLYHSSCINCDSYEEKLINLENEFQIKIKKLDYSKFNNNDLSLLKSSNSFLEDDIPIPVILCIKSGNEVASISGIKEYSALKNFVNLALSDNGVNNFNKINVDDYLKLVEGKEKSIIYICDSSDSCDKFSSLLDTVSLSRKFKVNYLNMDNISLSDDWKKLEESNKIFKDMWFMPVIMIVKNDKVVDYKMEIMNESELNKFFKKNGM